jgi:hypothetical protein
VVGSVGTAAAGRVSAAGRAVRGARALPPTPPRIVRAKAKTAPRGPLRDTIRGLEKQAKHEKMRRSPVDAAYRALRGAAPLPPTPRSRASFGRHFVRSLPGVRQVRGSVRSPRVALAQARVFSASGRHAREQQSRLRAYPR